MFPSYSNTYLVTTKMIQDLSTQMLQMLFFSPFFYNIRTTQTFNPSQVVAIGNIIPPLTKSESEIIHDHP